MHNIITEELIINGVKMGYSRLDIHERIRSILTKPMKSYDEDNNFDLSKIKNIFEKDDVISKIIEKNNISLEPMNYIGRCVEQVDKYYSE
jgi:adenylosuccinate lyase